MKHKTFNIALMVLAAVAALGILGPTLDADDWRSAAGDQAVIEHRAEIRVLQAAIAMCGSENATAVDLGDGRWQCLSTGGRRHAGCSQMSAIALAQLIALAFALVWVVILIVVAHMYLKGTEPELYTQDELSQMLSTENMKHTQRHRLRAGAITEIKK